MSEYSLLYVTASQKNEKKGVRKEDIGEEQEKESGKNQLPVIPGQSKNID